MALANAAGEIGELVGKTIDVIVIGSGYGAGVCAARLAQAGAKSVVVLERGREFSVSAKQPFPSDSKACRDNVHISGGPFGDSHRLGLYDFHISKDLDVLVGCGLGGTSLINASVAIEPDFAVFQRDAWPAPIRASAADGTLRTYYDRALEVLQPNPWHGPDGAPVPRKLRAMEASGAYRANINVNFDAAATHNAIGVRQGHCTNCGDCSTGCNFEAKRTLCFTYLPIAKSYGAKIFVQCDVREIVQAPDGSGDWLVRYQRLLDGNEPIDANLNELRAKRIVLGAGVLGSTGLLLRSKAANGLPVSEELGGRVSGNGDAVALSYNGAERLDSVGYGAKEDPAHPVGPSITGVIDHRNNVPLDDGIIIEEGAFPSAMAAAMRWLVEVIPGGEETRHGFTHWFQERIAEGRDLFGDKSDGALNKTLVFLLMGHDGADGVIELDKHGRAYVSWPELHERDVFTAENAQALAVAANLGGKFVPDPLATKWFLNNNITVHPLGGCPMGDAGSEAVVDHVGRVFDNAGGTLAGLYVADGSVIPTSLGCNPLLTITALAERTAEHIAAEMGLAWSPATKLGPLPVDP